MKVRYALLSIAVLSVSAHAQEALSPEEVAVRFRTHTTEATQAVQMAVEEIDRLWQSMDDPGVDGPKELCIRHERVVQSVSRLRENSLRYSDQLSKELFAAIEDLSKNVREVVPPCPLPFPRDHIHVNLQFIREKYMSPIAEGLAIHVRMMQIGETTFGKRSKAEARTTIPRYDIHLKLQLVLDLVAKEFGSGS